MFYFVKLFSKTVVSRHKTIRGANMAQIAFSDDFYMKNHVYLPTAILYKSGKPVPVGSSWIDDPEIELGLTDPPGREGEHIWK
jgi:hypothetical protein